MRELTRLVGGRGGQMNRLEVEVIFTPDLRQRFLPCRCVNNKEEDWHYIRDAQVEFKIVRSHKFFLIPYIYIYITKNKISCLSSEYRNNFLSSLMIRFPYKIHRNRSAHRFTMIPYE